MQEEIRQKAPSRLIVAQCAKREAELAFGVIHCAPAPLKENLRGILRKPKGLQFSGLIDNEPPTESKRQPE